MPFYDTLSSARRRRTVPGLADEPGLDAYLTADDYLAAPGLAPDDADMSFSVEETDAFNPNPDMTFDVAEVDAPVPGAPPNRSVGNALASALASAFPVTSGAFRALPGAASALAQRYQNAPAPVVAGAVPAGSPPAVSPSSPGAQPQGAGAATPPGQPAPSPVTPAPSSDQPYQPRGELATAAEAFAQPAIAKETGRSDKMLGRGAPADGYGMTDTERARLDEARRGDRRMRIGSGIAQGLGALLGTIGVATDTPGLAGLGMTGMQIGRSIPAGRRAEEVLGDVERRQQALAAQNAAEARQLQLATDADRVGVQRLGAEAGMVRAQGQAQLDLANAANAQFERLAAEGNAEGMREVIRSLITAMPDDARKAALVNRFMRGTPSGDAFDRVMDLPSLRAAMDEVANLNSPGMQIERARGRGIGPSSGGMAIDPTTGQVIEQQVSGGGGRAPAGPSFSDPFTMTQQGAVGAPAVVPAPGARPARPSARRGRAAAATGAPVAAGAPAAPVPQGPPMSEEQMRSAVEGTAIQLNTDTRQRIQDIADTLRDEGVDPASPGGARELRTILAGLTSDSAGTRTQTEAELRNRQTAANEARAAGQAIGVPPTIMARLQREIEPLVTVHRDMSAVIRDLQAYQRTHPVEFRAALLGNPIPGEGNAEAYGMIRTYFAENKHRLTGAAATDSETRDLMSSMGLGTLPAISDPDAFLNLMVRRRNEMNGQILRRARNIDVRGAARFLAAEYPGQRERIYQALGYTERDDGGR